MKIAMRRSTRSSGNVTSPELEFSHDVIERNTRSRVATEDLVVLDLPRISRTTRHPSSSEATETRKEPLEKSTRSRKTFGDADVVEPPRASRTGKRGASGRSPDAPKQAHKESGSTSSEGRHKQDKRDLSPEEPVRATSTKKRRRSGRLAETEFEDQPDAAEKQSRGEEHKVDKKRDASSSSSDSKQKQGKGDQASEESVTEAPSKRRRRSGQPAEKETEKADISEREKPEKEHKVDQKADKKGKSSREKAKSVPKEAEEADEQHDEDNEEEQKKEDTTLPSRRRRTRSGRFVIGEESENQIDDSSVREASVQKSQETDAHDSKSCRSSSRHVKEKGTSDNPQLRSPPMSPEKAKKSEAAQIDVQKLDIDVSELTVKTSWKEPLKGPQSPRMRSSPRKSRQPSGQKGQSLDSALERTDAQVVKPEDDVEHNSRSDKTQEHRVEELSKLQSEKQDQDEVQKKTNATRRDLSSEFNEIDKGQKSPCNQSRSRKDQDSDQGNDTSNLRESVCTKSPRGKKDRSPVKSPRGDAGAVSPRKGLRSCKEPELDVTTVGDVTSAGSGDQDSKVDVVSMETNDPPALRPISGPPLESLRNMKNVVSEAREAAQMVLPEAKRQPTLNEMLALSLKKEEDDVSEIPDDIATKIREWKVHEEDSLGFQGDDWEEEEVDEGEPFYFESDHMALKGNKDYRMLLRTITTLEAQRKQAIKDLDKLVVFQREALRNPLKFVHKLQKKDTLRLPSAQRIVLLPDIPWGRYLGHADSKELIVGLSHHTRGSLKPKPKSIPVAEPSIPAQVPSSHPGMMAGSSTSQATAPVTEDEKNKSTIRGRLWDDTKPDTFNRLWTVEEQKRLEELLVKYPTEEIEARRWEKVAKELGNRSRVQVASRVQKFFIKLGKAGLPIPGRMPHMATYATRRTNHQRRYVQPYNKMTMAPSTFYQSIRAPVLMNDDDDDFYMEQDYEDDSIMEEDDVPPELKDSAEFQELMRLKKLRNITLKQQDEASHVGFSCDACGIDPIIGVRWHCMTCPDDVSTDLCQNCVEEEFQSEAHNSSHRLEPIHTRQSGGFVDSDYTSFTGTSGDYNYLDPNYTPAVLG